MPLPHTLQSLLSYRPIKTWKYSQVSVKVWLRLPTWNIRMLAVTDAISFEDQLLRDREKLDQFEKTFLRHLDAAYNLARWLLGEDQDAEDVVQEAYFRALKFFDSSRVRESRAWLLRIVRNVAYTHLRRQRGLEPETIFDETVHGLGDGAADPEALLLRHNEVQLLKECLEALPVKFREVLILRELEGLSYKEIAAITDISLGTVMSRLARSRKRLRDLLCERQHKGAEK